MKEAQRFPGDFDGIIAGAPGLDWTGRAAQAVRVAKMLETNEPARLTQAQIQRLHRAVVQACDAHDGVTDGLIDDPTRCTFDPAVLRCEGDDATCLTLPQIETVRFMYSNPANPRSKRAITGLAPGSELGWTSLGWTASARATGLDQFRFLVFKDPAWTIRTFNFDTDVVRAEETDNGTINALDPNLKPFIDRGGKLIHYHGWSDPQISPGNSTQVLLTSDRGGGWRFHTPRLVPALHGARDGSLWRRRRTERIGCGQCARAVGRTRQGPRPDCCLTLHQRRRGPYPTTVSVSAARGL